MPASARLGPGSLRGFVSGSKTQTSRRGARRVINGAWPRLWLYAGAADYQPHPVKDAAGVFFHFRPTIPERFISTETICRLFIQAQFKIPPTLFYFSAPYYYQITHLLIQINLFRLTASFCFAIMRRNNSIQPHRALILINVHN
ncbi:hypothetical protein [Pseudogulbenkiania ferrooxidans]|uniref:hypothetical protein n=1 Tax=Pseudogulbenkiania ferrooxidans TaxID=549169 RepID=UPI0012691D6B|nr:hypothetical protein [Pseudogulbenkiania ferrooxidans]